MEQRAAFSPEIPRLFAIGRVRRAKIAKFSAALRGYSLGLTRRERRGIRAGRPRLPEPDGPSAACRERTSRSKAALIRERFNFDAGWYRLFFVSQVLTSPVPRHSQIKCVLGSVLKLPRAFGVTARIAARFVASPPRSYGWGSVRRLASNDPRSPSAVAGVLKRYLRGSGHTRKVHPGLPSEARRRSAKLNVSQLDRAKCGFDTLGSRPERLQSRRLRVTRVAVADGG